MSDINTIKYIVSGIASKYEVQNIYVFGSTSRGENTNDSDIDLRVDFTRPIGLFKLAGFKMELEEKLQSKVDVVVTDSLDNNFINEIKKDEVLIYVAQ